MAKSVFAGAHFKIKYALYEVIQIYCFFLFVLALFSQCTTVNSTSPIQTNTQIIPTYPQSISFAGEAVPLDKHYILERLDRELLVNNFWHSNSILVLKRAAKYFPIIEPILQENGIPDDFKYLAVIESGLTHVVSPCWGGGVLAIYATDG